MQRWMTKSLCGVLMLIATLICFLLPVKLIKSFRNRPDGGKHYLDLLNCFAGGVFFAAYLIFMAPAVREMMLVNLMIPNNIEYPLPDLLIGLGFFILVILNKIVVTIIEISSSSNEKQEPAGLNQSNLHNHNHLDGLHQLQHTHQNNFCCQQCGYKSMSHDDSNITTNGKDVVYTFEFLPDNHPAKTVNPPSPALSRHASILDIVNQDSMVRSIVLMMALSVDSLLEGVTTGLKTTNVEVWAIFISNFIHEAVISFCLGLQLTKVYSTMKPLVIAAIAYSLMNPVGLAIATIVYELQETSPMMDLVNGFIQALTSGCFIYVTFCEILEGQITNRMPLSKIISAMAGFLILAAFAAIPESSSYSALESACMPTNATIVH